MDRYAETEPALPAGADHNQSLNGLIEEEFDVRVRKCRPTRAVHLHRREVDRARDQRRTRRPKSYRLGQTGMVAPPGDLGQIERTPPLVDCGKGCCPTARRPAPTVRTCCDRVIHSVVTRLNGHVDAVTSETAYG